MVLLQLEITEADVSVHSSHHIPPEILYCILGGSFFGVAKFKDDASILTKLSIYEDRFVQLEINIGDCRSNAID